MYPCLRWTFTREVLLADCRETGTVAFASLEKGGKGAGTSESLRKTMVGMNIFDLKFFANTLQFFAQN